MMIFLQYLFLNKKKVSFGDFFMMTWDQENQSEVKKEPQIPRQKESQKHKSWD